MIKPVEGFSKHVAIAGFKDVRIDDVDYFLNSIRREFGDVEIQFLDAKLVAGWEHLYFAVLNAVKAFRNKTNISKTLAVECLLYASARRQIKNALGLIGVNQNSSQIAALIVADQEETAELSLEKVSKLVPGERDDAVLDLSDEKMNCIRGLFGISDVELESRLSEAGEKKALSELVIEHVALLVTQR